MTGSEGFEHPLAGFDFLDHHARRAQPLRAIGFVIRSSDEQHAHGAFIRFRMRHSHTAKRPENATQRCSILSSFTVLQNESAAKRRNLAPNTILWGMVTSGMDQCAGKGKDG